jgi:hypothetical protein
MVGRFIFPVMAAGVALIAGCGGSATKATTPTAPATTPTASVVEAPMPRHVIFAPGETIRADGQAGIFFLDPVTGAAEAWLVSAATFQDAGPLPFSFTVGGFSADGRKVVYTCMEPKVNSGPVPCGGATDNTWYLLDTKSGQRTRLTAFTGPFASISPDGKTLLGATADSFALANAEPPGAPRPIASTAGSEVAYTHAEWSADGGRLVLTVSTPPASGSTVSTFLVDTTNGRVTALDGGGAWSPDGARLISWKQMSDEEGELRMLDRDGRLVWSKRSTGAAGGWSADGSLLYAQVLDQPRVSTAYGPLERVEVIDSNTGATAFRIRGGLCPVGWVAGTHRLLTESYGFGEALVDLEARGLRLIDAYARPTPLDANTAIIFDGSDFRSYDLATGATKLIVHTTVTPAWDPNHGALFAGDRLVFTALHGGHGGCGEGAGPQNPPRPELLVGPFADDAPVTAGPGQ